MKHYYIHVVYGGVQVSISAVKHETAFFQALSRAIYDRLVGIHFMTRVCDDGIILESNSIPESFLGTTIPLLYHNRKLELQVYPEAF